MLLWILLIVLPFALSVGVALRPRLPLPVWFVLIAICALLEIMIASMSGTFLGPRQLAAASLLLVIIPWALAAAYLWLMRNTSRPLVSAIGASIVYYCSMGIGVLSGALPATIPQ
jgi:hypothetical protein